MARPKSLNTRLNELIDQFTPTIRDAFRASVQGIKDDAVLSDIVDAIEAGDPDRAFRALGINDAAMRPMIAELERAFETGGVLAASSAPKGARTASSAVFRFDVRNSRAEAYLRDKSSKLVTIISDEQREAVRDIINAGTRDGLNPRNVALNIVGRIDQTTGRRVGGVIGLNGPQARAVARARAELSSGDPSEMSKWFDRTRRDKRFDRTVQAAINKGVPLDKPTISKLVNRYADSLLQLRGETVGRTEAMNALNRSQMEAFEQAIEQGVIKRNAVQRVWDSTGDDGRTRHSHLAMDGQTVGLGEPFTTPSGDKLMYPGDSSLGASADETINCRCRVATKVDWFAGLESDPPEPAPVPIPTPEPPRPAPLPPVPEPEPEPPGLRYPSSMDDAEQWARDNGIARNVRMPANTNVEDFVTMVQNVVAVNERFGDAFDAEPLGYIGDPDRISEIRPGALVQWDARMVAAYAPGPDWLLMKGRALSPASISQAMNNETEQQRTFRAGQTGYKARKRTSGADKVDAEVLARLERITSLPWSVSVDQFGVIAHELGHRVDRFNEDAIRKLVTVNGRNVVMSSGWNLLISEYGATLFEEYVAETFSLYVQGDESQFFRIYPPLLEFYKGLDKKNGSA